VAVIIREMAFHVKDLSTYGRVLSTCVANSQNRTRITRINNTRRLVVHNTYARSFPGNTDKHGRIGIVHAHVRQSTHKPSLSSLHCPALDLHCAAELELLQALGHAAYARYRLLPATNPPFHSHTLSLFTHTPTY
jgi:hypothetical protein